MTKAKIIKIAESLDWRVNFQTQRHRKRGTTDKYVDFQKYSPAGQDFICTVFYKNLDEVADELLEYAENYDPSEEASLWLDESGHGTRGAPHDMGDVYKDMCDCKEMMSELYDALVA